MRRRVRILSVRVAAFAALATMAACGEPLESGVGEPIRVENAVFRPGTMPGTQPFEGSAEGSGAAAEGSSAGPEVTTVEFAGGIFYPWQQNRRVAGRTSAGASAIGIQLADVGTGYWVRPVDGADALANFEQTFELFLSIGEVEPGLHDLRLVAFDEDGRAGEQREFPICVASEIPDNLNVCEPTIKPPGAVVSLSWNAPSDVDLVLVGPGGEVIEARRPFGASADGGIPADVLRDATIPRFDRDSNAGCGIDGRQRENVIFPEPPTQGTWLIYARLFDACGEVSVTVTVEVFRRLDRGDGTFELLEVAEGGTSFTAIQADGGAGQPTYLFPLTFP